MPRQVPRTYSTLEFTKAWMQAYQEKAGLPGVAKLLNVPVKEVPDTAASLRSYGVKLPRMRTRPNKNAVNTVELNNLIRQSM